MKKTWKVKALTAKEPGKLVWTTIREFTSPETADNWLAGYIKENGLICTDFRITTK